MQQVILFVTRLYYKNEKTTTFATCLRLKWDVKIINLPTQFQIISLHCFLLYEVTSHWHIGDRRKKETSFRIHIELKFQQLNH